MGSEQDPSGIQVGYEWDLSRIRVGSKWGLNSPCAPASPRPWRAGRPCSPPQLRSSAGATVLHPHSWTLIAQPLGSVTQLPPHRHRELPASLLLHPGCFLCVNSSFDTVFLAGGWTQGSVGVLCPSTSMPTCQTVVTAETRLKQKSNLHFASNLCKLVRKNKM